MTYPQTRDGRLGITLATGQFYPHSFDLAALEEVEYFAEQHSRCMWYSDVAHESVTDTTAIAIRHDVDHSIVHAHRFASWEAEKGINASYYILPTAPYFKKEDTIALALDMQAMGHEIGVHNDAHCEAMRRVIQGGRQGLVDEQYIARFAIDILADWAATMREAGLHISGCADHGGGDPKNVDLWIPRGEYTPASADLAYECYALHHRPQTAYLSDNRGRWNGPVENVDGKQTHMLIHPCHWRLP